MSLGAMGETLVTTDAGGRWGRGRDMGSRETRGEGRWIGGRGLVYDLLEGGLLGGGHVVLEGGREYQETSIAGSDTGIFRTRTHLVFVVKASHFLFPVLLVAVVTSDGG